jgi:hypothetical protein
MGHDHPLALLGPANYSLGVLPEFEERNFLHGASMTSYLTLTLTSIYHVPQAFRNGRIPVLWASILPAQSVASGLCTIGRP